MLEHAHHLPLSELEEVTIGVRSVNGDMAHRACLVLLRLVVE